MLFLRAMIESVRNEFYFVELNSKLNGKKMYFHVLLHMFGENEEYKRIWTTII